MTSADRLRAIADAAPAALGDDGIWLAQAIERYLAGAQDGVTLDATLGLSVRPGESPWWRIVAQRRRDAGIRQLADQLLTEGTPDERVDLIRAEIRRFEPRWIARERTRSECPSDFSEIDRTLFGIFAESEILNTPPPRSQRQLKKILSVCFESQNYGNRLAHLHSNSDAA